MRAGGEAHRVTLLKLASDPYKFSFVQVFTLVQVRACFNFDDPSGSKKKLADDEGIESELERAAKTPFVGSCLGEKRAEKEASELQRVTLQGNVQLVFCHSHLPGLLVVGLVELIGISQLTPGEAVSAARRTIE